jgi:hypothetical protein
MTTPLPPEVRQIRGSDYLAESGQALRSLLDDVVDLGQSSGPPSAQEFVLEKYIPTGYVTSLYAKGGSAKSFLALILAFHIVRGEKVFDCDVQQGPVLYLDAELDEKTAERRAWMIARGRGVQRLPGGLYYYRLRDSLTNPAYNEGVKAIIDQFRPRLTIIDSFTAAVRGKDTNSLDDVSDRLRWLESFGTVLMIDHTPKNADIGSTATAIGSVAKQMFARSALFVATNGKASVLRHDKSNFGPHAEPIRFALNFTDACVTLEAPLASDDLRLHGIEEALPARERVRDALCAAEYPNGASAKELADSLEMNVKTVSNALSWLKSENHASNAGGKWFATR